MVCGFQGARLSFMPTSKTMETDPSWKPDPVRGGRGVCRAESGGVPPGLRPTLQERLTLHSSVGRGQDLGTSQPSPCSQGPCALMGRQTKLVLQAAVSDMKKANRACGTSFSVPEGVPAPHCLSTIHLLAPLLTQPQCWWYGYDDSSENVSQLPLQQGLPMR